MWQTADPAAATETKPNYVLRQMLIGTAAALASASTGSHTTVPAVLVPQLTASDSQLAISETQATWFASMHALAAMLGSLLGGWVVHSVGPRRTLLLMSLPTLAGWLLMAAAPNYTALLVARLVVGVSTGVALSASQVYLGEAASPELRGRLVCVSGLLNTVGCLLSYVVGLVAPWRWVPVAPVLLFVAPSALALVVAVPESPYWLLARRPDNPQLAGASLRQLRGDRQWASYELGLMQQLGAAPPAAAAAADGDPQQQQQQQQQQQRQRRLGSLWHVLGELRHVTVLMPLLSVCALFVCRVLSGIIPVMVYAVEIFDEMRSSHPSGGADGGGGADSGGGGGGVSGGVAAVVIGTVRIFTSLASVLYFSDRFGRRPLLIMSGLVCCAVSACQGALLLLRHSYGHWPGWQRLHWTPLLLMIVFLLAFDVGFSRTGWVIQSELLPTRVRAAFSGLTICVHFVTSFLSVLVFPTLRRQLTLGGVFLVFAVFSFLGFLVVFFFIPETKHKRLEEIEHFYRMRFSKTRPSLTSDQQQQQQQQQPASQITKL